MGLSLLFSVVFLSCASLRAETGVAESTQADGSIGPAPTSEDIMQREIDRRQESSFRLEQTLAIADRLFQSGEWDHAEAKYTLVMLGTNPEGQMAGYHQRARIGKSKCLVAKAMVKEDEGSQAEAVGLIRQALDLDPGNKSLAKRAETMRETSTRSSDPYPGNAAVTSKLVEKTVEIKKLLAQADQLAETGQYEKARKCLDDVRRSDPYNRAALKKIENLENRRIQAANKRYAASREKALAEVSETWFPSPPAEIPAKSSIAGASRKSTAGQILKKLADIKIQELTFNEKPIREAVQELQRLSELYDPEKRGLNFVLRLPPPSEGKDPESATVSFELRDISLQTALKYLCEQVRGGDKLRPEVEDSAIFLLPATESGVELENRIFSLPPSVIASLPASGETGTLGRDDPKKLGEDILKNIGVNTAMEGSSAVCFRDTGKLVVRNTPNELNKIEQRIRDAQGEKPQKQFEVETKFLQFSDTEAKRRFRQ